MANMKSTSSKRRPWVKNREAQSGRLVDNYNLYNSQSWRKLSISYRHKNPLCEVNLSRGRTTAADVVDHIVPVAQGGATWDSRNLMAMSHKNHNKKSAMERHKKILVQYTTIASGEKIPAIRDEIKTVLLGGGGVRF